MKNIEWTIVKEPEKDCTGIPIDLTEKTINERKSKLLNYINSVGLDKVVIYVDVEHGSNFEYLVGYFTRFEEGLLIVDKSGDINLMLGNENLNKASKARIDIRKTIHASLFSLPNQPNRNDFTFKELLLQTGLSFGQKVGVVGWKNFTSIKENNSFLYDVPYYIVDSILDIVGSKNLICNANYLFIGENGIRRTNNPNEIAHYEYYASLASDCMLDAMNSLCEGVNELDISDKLVRYGQHTSVVTIAAFGERFINANMFPRNNRLKLKDTVSLTVGYRGGSSSRCGYAVYDKTQLPLEQYNYLERIAIPYFNAYVFWLEKIKCGMKGKDMYDLIESVLPKEKFGWSLCPGHLTAEEEWMASPIYDGSEEELKSGMIFQIDIIPSVEGYSGVSAESTVLLADKQLQNEILNQYPDMFHRMMNRREYLINELNINLSDDIMPMCSTVAYLRPFLLTHDKALKVKK